MSFVGWGQHTIFIYWKKSIIFSIREQLLIQGWIKYQHTEASLISFASLKSSDKVSPSLCLMHIDDQAWMLSLCIFRVTYHHVVASRWNRCSTDTTCIIFFSNFDQVFFYFAIFYYSGHRSIVFMDVGWQRLISSVCGIILGTIFFLWLSEVLANEGCCISNVSPHWPMRDVIMQHLLILGRTLLSNRWKMGPSAGLKSHWVVKRSTIIYWFDKTSLKLSTHWGWDKMAAIV